MPSLFSRIALALALAVPLTCVAAEGEAPATDGGDVQPTKTGGEAEPKAPQPFLGVVVRPTAEADFDGPSGLVVDRVFPRTTAVELGLQRGDVVTTFNDQPTPSREALKKILEGAKVGDKVTVRYLRGEERIAGAAALKARPTRESVNEALEEAGETVGELQAARATQLADLEAARAEEKTLAESMQELSTVLSELPGKLDQTAKQFKAVYPDGEFTVDIQITIRSHPESAATIDLSPAAPPSTGAEEPATDDAVDAGEPEPLPAEQDDVAPPPTKPPGQMP